MHTQPDPRRLIAAAAAAFALMLGALVLPPVTAELDVSLGGAGPQAASDAAPADPRPAQSQPRWLTDPLSPPRLAGR
jgi:hypothetical protein